MARHRSWRSGSTEPTHETDRRCHLRGQQEQGAVSNYYKQNVYDSSDAKIGEISDVLLNKDGKVDAFMIAVGGFLGVGEKDVAVPFDAIHATQKDGKWYLSVDTTRDALKNARGYKFDKAKSTWEPA
jgi:sporulation protein YlmC with PRC-barrel domain